MRRASGLAGLRVLMGVLGVSGTWASAAQQTIYSTGFENPPFAAGSQLLGQDGWSTAIPSFLNPTAAVIATSTPKAGTQDVQVRGSDLASGPTDIAPYDAIGSYRYPTNYTVSTFPILRLEVDTRIATTVTTATTNDFWSQTISARSGDGETLGEFGLSSAKIAEGYAYNAAPGATPAVTKPIEFNTWYHLTMDIDFLKDTTTYAIDGTVLGTIASPSASNVLLRGAMVAYALPNSGGNTRSAYTALFDNFSVTAVPEPTSWGATLAAAAAMLRRRRVLLV